MSRSLRVFIFTFLVLLTQAAKVSAQPVAILSQYLRDDLGEISSLSFRDYKTAVQVLTDEFNHICGDMFCEGEFSEIIPINFECVINTETKLVGQCTWLFFAYENDLDGATGTLVRREKVARCAIPFSGELSAFRGFLIAATTVDPITNVRSLFKTVIPGSHGKTIYGALSDCLN